MLRPTLALLLVASGVAFSAYPESPINDVPLGSRLWVDGVGECEVRDRMNRRYTGTHAVDLYFGFDLGAARAFGRRNGTAVWVVSTP